jgi:hypothetical protein
MGNTTACCAADTGSNAHNFPEEASLQASNALQASNLNPNVTPAALVAHANAAVRTLCT